MDAVRHLEHLRHVVRDEDDRQAPFTQILDHLEHSSGLVDAEGGRGLVEDDHLAAESRGARHGHGLTLTTGQGLHRLRDVLQGADAEVPQMLSGVLTHPLLVESAKDLADEARLAHLTTEVEVAGDVQRG